MIYLDTSVALAHLLGETRRPAVTLWEEPLVASRLLQYELWCRVNARGLGVSHGEEVRQLLGQIAFVELAPQVLERALQPFSTPLRTLDGMHLATLEYLRSQGHAIRLASYDERLSSAASELGISSWSG